MTEEIDYNALAAKARGESRIDYSALAKKARSSVEASGSSDRMTLPDETGEPTGAEGAGTWKDAAGILEAVPAMSTGAPAWFVGSIATPMNAAINALRGSDKPWKEAVQETDEFLSKFTYSPKTEAGEISTKMLTYGALAATAPYLLPFMGVGEALDSETAKKAIPEETLHALKAANNVLMLGVGGVKSKSEAARAAKELKKPSGATLEEQGYERAAGDIVSDKEKPGTIEKIDGKYVFVPARKGIQPVVHPDNFEGLEASEKALSVGKLTDRIDETRAKDREANLKKLEQEKSAESMKPENSLEIEEAAKRVSETIVQTPEAKQHIKNLESMPKSETPEQIAQLSDYQFYKRFGRDRTPEESRAIKTQKPTIAKHPIKRLSDYLFGPPEENGRKNIVGKHKGDMQEVDLELTNWAKGFKKSFSSDRRNAMTAYRESGGDPTTLKKWAALTKDKTLRKGYEDALSLTPEEIAAVKTGGDRLNAAWEEAVIGGVEVDFVKNYVRHQWEKENTRTRKISEFENNFKLDPSEAKKRVFANYFEGEQAGYKPTSKDFAYQVVTAERSLKEAVSSRKAMKDLISEIDPDGRPVLVVGRWGKPLLDAQGKPGTRNPAKVVKSNADTVDLRGYQYLDHESLKGWQYEVQGEISPILMEGGAWVHPKHYGPLKAVFGKSKIRTAAVPDSVPILGGWQPGKSALEASSAVKGTVLVGPFHLSHVSQHAIFHKVNPFSVREIDFKSRPVLKEGVDNGLLLSNHNALQEFSEGVASGGLWNRIPDVNIGGTNYGFQALSEFTFQEFIPKLKAEMFEKAFEENLNRYNDQMAKGKINRRQIAEITARQANAAFGELNYEYMGRNKTLQDIFKLTALAPDFLEARVKFVAQALKPYGREQQMALARSAIGYTAIAQIVNMIYAQMTGEKYDAKERMKHPFSVKIGDREFTPRSVMGDFSHAVFDFRGFVHSRLNPITTKPGMEAITGRDVFGRKQTAKGILSDTAKGVIPIPFQEFAKDDDNSTLQKIMYTAMQSIGLSNYNYRTDAEKEQFRRMPKFDQTQTEESKESKKIIKQGMALAKTDENAAIEFLYDNLDKGKIGKDQFETAWKEKEQNAFVHYFHKHMGVKRTNTEEGSYAALYVRKLMTPEQKKATQEIFDKKINAAWNNATPQEQKELQRMWHKILPEEFASEETKK